MSYRPTGRMIQPEPRKEKHLVCDQCGAAIGKEGGRDKPHFELRWDVDVGYDDDGYNSWQADICSVECLQKFAAAGAPPVDRDYS